MPTKPDYSNANPKRNCRKAAQLEDESAVENCASQ